MSFSLECSCGRSLAVQAAQAGTTLRCPCGAEVDVPSVGRLRELAGRLAYEAGTIDVIRGMLWRGELPAGDRCAISGESTDDVADLSVEAERIYPGGDHRAYAWLGLLVSPILLLGLFQEPRPDVGRETIVPTPLRVASCYHPKLRRSGQRALKRWLRTVPIYARLLEEFPRARVKVGETA
ncbi:hypothetical protein [Tautonia plasticadhaerens]|uniref:Uncharacterized protein n=1 Tax=Tautonia plasticadhaerens TaxID=2527974 RepID=A0A518HCE2_9BACT|nr:hypothetical protein [Tautonia plasticadhaerens]QDV38532.1 hypothetical protein ElP_64870 [Tautonia plasticadhaerens]